MYMCRDKSAGKKLRVWAFRILLYSSCCCWQFLLWVWLRTPASIHCAYLGIHYQIVSCLDLLLIILSTPVCQRLTIMYVLLCFSTWLQQRNVICLDSWTVKILLKIRDSRMWRCLCSNGTIVESCLPKLVLENYEFIKEYNKWTQLIFNWYLIVQQSTSVSNIMVSYMHGREIV